MSQYCDTRLSNLIPTYLFDGIRSFLRRLVFLVLAFGPMPRHISFIPDGNRRYGHKKNLQEGEAYCIGFVKLISVLMYCYEMGVPCVSFYAFSIDNYRRKPVDVATVIKLIQEKSEALIQNNSIMTELGVRVEYLGNLDLLDELTRETAKKVMALTAKNTKILLLILIAYTSTDEIVHGVQGSCEEKWALKSKGEGGGVISVEDLERHMYLAGHPDPDILIRTAGATRLSNFLLWQTTSCLLYAPRCLWPEISLRHIVWAVLLFQRNYLYFEKIKKKLSSICQTS